MRLFSAFMLIGGTTLLLSSCGGEENVEKSLYEELCDCVEFGEKANEEFFASGANEDSTSAANFRTKYKTEIENCEEVSSLIALEFEDLTDDEQKEKELEIRAICPALDEQMKEQERMQEEMLQNMMMGGGEEGEGLTPEQMEQIQRMMEEGMMGEDHDHEGHDHDHDHSH